MKILRLVLITSMCIMLTQVAKAQIKIGDNKLDIGDERQFEIEKAGKFFVITDSLELGRTTNPTTNTLSDALMVKLLGYGINEYFHPISGDIDQYSIASGGTMSNVFLGITEDGEVMESPLRLLLDVDTTNGYLSLFNEVDTFGTVNLAALDSIFVTDNELTDSLNTIRTLINNSNDADNDTITGNEYIDTIQVLGDTALRFIENRDERLGLANVQDVDLSPIIDAQTFYKADGTLDEDRTVDGGTNTLTFNNVSNFNVTSTEGVDIVTDTVDIDGNLTLQDYGGDGIKGTVTTILAVDADGNVIETTPDEILSNQVDSTIYNNDGTLLADRTLSGNTNDLTFDGLGAFTTTTSGNTSINADTTLVSQELQFTSYGDTSIVGTLSTILAVDTDGNVIEITAEEVLSNDLDSTIYNSNGTLLADRTLSGNTNDLTFDGLGAFTTTTSGNTNINADTTLISQEFQLTSYGDTSIVGTLSTILAVDTDGNVIEITAEEVLSSDLDSTIYNSDGTLLGDRTLSGNTNDLTFDGLGAFTTTTSGNTNINADTTLVSQQLQLSGYGDTSQVGTYTTVLGVDINGNVIEIQSDEILASETDSTIYTHDGTLTGERTMLMAGNNLFFIGDGTPPNDTVVITNDGRMAIGKGSVMTGTGTTNDVRLDVNGDILAIQVHSSSDRRFKKNINPVENALNKVLGMQGVTYDFRTDEFLNRNFPTTKQLGFIAQDIESQLPEVVRTNPDGYKAVDYAKVTALLVEAIKDQQVIIDELQEKVELSASLNTQLIEEVRLIKADSKKLSSLELADED